jgi:dihydroorotate dehydrogenase
MTLIEKFYPVMKPWLFRLDAERAHTLTVKMMVIAHRLGMLKSVVSTPQQPRKVMGLTFPNVLGLAAGMDKSASAVDAWAALGFGFVEVGTLTPRPQPGNSKPRLFRLPEHEALINRMGFNNPGIHSAVKKLEEPPHEGRGGREHRQKLRHAERESGGRLPALPEGRVWCSRLHRGEHLLAEHEGTA